MHVTSLPETSFFLLSKIGVYARESNQDADKILMKRAMGIALGVFAVYELTDLDHRPGTKEYPPFADRFHALISQISAPAENDFWIFAANTFARNSAPPR